MLTAWKGTGAVGTEDESHAQVGMCTNVRAVGLGPGSVSSDPIDQLRMTSASSAGPVGKGGRSSCARGGNGGGALPAMYGAENTYRAPAQ